MPRNSSGTYSLPAGNPVVTATVISSVWANTTMSDIGNEITQSLDRSGDGGMLAPLQLDNGLIGAPGLTWSSETSSGLYRAGAGDFRYSIAAVDKLQLTTNGAKVADGAIATPSWSFISDPDTGVYRAAANTVGIVGGGVTARFFVDNLSAYVTLGSATNPGLAFSTDVDTGIYSLGSNRIGFAAGGAFMGEFRGDLAGTPFQINDGTVALPAYSFSNDQDTGIYRVGANDLGFSIGGSLFLRINSSLGIAAQTAIGMQDGVFNNPSLYYINDTDTGLYRVSADNIAVSVGGQFGMNIASLGGGISSFSLGSGLSTVSGFNLNTTGTATAGGSTLPANPQGFMQLLINGSQRRVPYYNP